MSAWLPIAALLNAVGRSERKQLNTCIWLFFELLKMVELLNAAKAGELGRTPIDEVTWAIRGVYFWDLIVIQCNLVMPLEQSHHPVHGSVAGCDHPGFLLLNEEDPSRTVDHILGSPEVSSDPAYLPV